MEQPIHLHFTAEESVSQWDEDDLKKLTNLLMNVQVDIHVSLGIGNNKATVWGCDLSHEYVTINTQYST